MAESINDIRGQKIKELVQEMKLYNNPQELEDMKKLIKKNVPFSMRGYLMAYLYITRQNPVKPKAPRADKEKSQAQKPALENATSFYINIGKASKSPAREMVEFICEKASLSAEDIVSVAYKQNYSFVHIKNEKKDGVIEAVNGQLYKGRKVKINFSKEKDEQ